MNQLARLMGAVLSDTLLLNQSVSAELGSNSGQWLYSHTLIASSMESPLLGEKSFSHTLVVYLLLQVWWFSDPGIFLLVFVVKLRIINYWQRCFIHLVSSSSLNTNLFLPLKSHYWSSTLTNVLHCQRKQSHKTFECLINLAAKGVYCCQPGDMWDNI